MGIDLLILDDYTEKLKLVKGLACQYQLECKTFVSGVEALRYIQSLHNGNIPKGYLVDMRIPGEDDNISKEIFFELERRKDMQNVREYFRFFTAHYSGHDKVVEEETGAIVIVKGGDVVQALREYMQLLKTEKERINVQSLQ